MNFHLVVRTPFDGHVVGELITDPKKVADILLSEAASFVTKIAAPAATPQE